MFQQVTGAVPYFFLFSCVKVKFSTSGYLVNVPKLKGRENYDDWAFATSIFLLLKGIDFEDLPTAISELEKKKAKLVITIDFSLYAHSKSKTTVYGRN